jgi:hypothetical protein
MRGGRSGDLDSTLSGSRGPDQWPLGLGALRELVSLEQGIATVVDREA